MKIDTALKEFSEKYDREAMQSIDDISKDFGLKVSRQTIKAFNISECFSLFQEYIKGYADYKIKNAGNKEASPREVIQESVSKFIDGELFKECDIQYPQLPEFVKSYVNGVSSLLTTVDSVKDRLIHESVDDVDIGDVNDYVDSFMDKVNNSFYETMDRILWASGYNARMAKINHANKPVVEFL